MRHELVIPSTADGALAVTVLNWLKKVGEPVTAGEDLVEAKTEKITLYITAPVNGHVAEIIVGPNEVVGIGDVVGYVEEA